MSKNYFAVFDSDDEGPAPQAKSAPKKDAKAPVAEPSKLSDRRRPNNNDRNTRGGRGGRAPSREGKRAYDRRSGTGRGRETKKGGGGARNWGSDKNDARRAEGAVREGEEEQILNPTPEEGEEVAKTLEEEGEGEGEGGEAGANGPGPEPQPEPENEPEPEPEDVTLTYEEYMKTKQQPDSEAFASLNVKELDEHNEFAGKKAKAKGEEEDFLKMGSGKSIRKKGGKQGKKSVDVGFRVARPDGDRRGSRDRRDGDRRDSGRGGGRGGRGGYGRGGRGGGGGGAQKKEINVSDTDDFPSLS